MTAEAQAMSTISRPVTQTVVLGDDGYTSP
jgi:hypothetical protein